MHDRLNVVLFWFMNDWGKYGRAYEQIAKALKRDKRINSVICIFPPTPAKGRQFWAQTGATQEGIVTITPYLQTINGFHSGYRIRRWFNQTFTPLRLLHWYLKWRSLSRKNTIAWIFPPHPFIFDLIPRMRFQRLVVQIVDNNAVKAAGSGQALAMQQYDQLTKIADLLITSSQFNYDFFRQKCKNCILVENGVSREFFADPTDFPHRRPGRAPILGYVGTISERTDLKLLLRIAMERPRMELYLAGPDNSLLPKSGLLELQNVKYLGEVPHASVPALIRTFDVCLIPHIDNQYSQAMSPLKLFQYLASGRPIVSTSVAGTSRWRDYIEIAASHDQFLEGIDNVLRNDSLLHGRRRIEAVRSETWEKRVEDMLSALPLRGRKERSQ